MKSKNTFQKLQKQMLTYCSKFEKVTYNVYPKNIIMMTNIKTKGISRCADCLVIKLLVDKIKDKYVLETIVSQFLIDFL